MGLNVGYVTTKRGIIKICMIIAGFVVCSFLCANWYGGKSCFGEGRIGFASGLNFVFVVANIVFFILNLCDVLAYKLERGYSVIGVILFLIAAILLGWYLFENNIQRGYLVTATILIVVQFVLFLVDLKILQGEISN